VERHLQRLCRLTEELDKEIAGRLKTLILCRARLKKRYVLRVGAKSSNQVTGTVQEKDYLLS
jgi:hypothetical protein